MEAPARGALVLLMFEMPFAGEEHRDACLIGKLDGILVPDAASRLNDSLDAVFCGKSDYVIEREETV